jgi:hypothetical protein
VEAQTHALALREKEAAWEQKVLELARSVDGAQSNLAQCQAQLSEETAAHSREMDASAAAAAAAAAAEDKLLQAETQRERDLLRARSVLDLLAFCLVYTYTCIHSYTHTHTQSCLGACLLGARCACGKREGCKSSRVAQLNPLCAAVRS